MSALKIQALILGLSILLCGITHAGPTGVQSSKHDMSIHTAASPNTGDNPIRFETQEICVFCHTPHNANPSMRPDTYWDGSAFVNSGAGTGQPFMLWNRDVVGSTTTGYSMYTSSTMEQTLTQVGPYTLMCLSCHDGVSAINVLHNRPYDMLDLDSDGYVDPDLSGSGYTTIGDVANNPANIGDRVPLDGKTVTDLSNDHPVSFDYTISQAADGGLKAADTAVGYVTDTRVRLFPRPTDPSGSRVYMECSTCHDVHNEGNKDASVPRPYQYPFLVASTEASYLCTTCHNK